MMARIKLAKLAMRPVKLVPLDHLIIALVVGLKPPVTTMHILLITVLVSLDTLR
jgi:hypothetical protein